MRVIIAGSRPPKDIRENLAKLEQWYEERYDVLDATITKSGMRELIEVVVCGEAAGWDELGKRWAESNGIEVASYPAKWRGKNEMVDMGAGFKRNLEMARNSDGLICFWNGKSKGARHMIATAEREWGGVVECERQIWVEVVDV